MTPQLRPNRTSLVPYYTFAETLAEQEAQLASNPLLRLAVGAKRTSLDIYRRTL